MDMTPPAGEIPEGFWEREASHAPRPVSALFRSLLPIFSDGFGRMFHEMGVLPERLEWREIRGWVYTRGVPPGGKDRKLPPTWLFPVVARLVPARRRRIQRAAEARRTDRFGGYLDCWEREWRPQLTAGIAELRAVDVTRLDDAGLARHLDDVMALARRAWDTHFVLHGVNAYVLGEFAFTGRELLGWPERRTFELLSGLSSASPAPGRALVALTDLARREPTIRRQIEAGEFTAVLDGFPDAAPDFAVALAAYHHEFGFRAIRYEPAEPTLEENPVFTLQLVADQLLSGFDPEATAVELARRRKEAGDEARALLAGRPADLERFERGPAASRTVLFRPGGQRPDDVLRAPGPGSPGGSGGRATLRRPGQAR